MKVAIVTFVRAYNYGAVLQCYALSKTLDDLGIEVEVLDYYPQYFKDCYNVTRFHQIHFEDYGTIKKWLVKKRFALVIAARNHGFERFLRRNVPLTQRQYTTLEEINSNNFYFDAYISGSDQVWSNRCVPFDPVYFLQFKAAEGTQKYSYAASFGFERVPDELSEQYKHRLRGWDKYSVRERSGIDILRSLIGTNATLCCDPTLLLTKNDWEKITKPMKHKAPYILLYSVNGCNELLRYGKELSQAKGLKVITLNSCMTYEKVMGFREQEHGFYPFRSASPEIWLGLFANAEYVLTDSFHGAVFSILNHKQFQVVTRLSQIRNNRVQELLENLSLTNRTLDSGISTIDDDIDWDLVDEQLQIIRNQSIRYLNTLFENGDAQNACG